jgi:transmembrane sensor
MSKIDDEALDWVVRQSSGTLDEAGRLAFEAWYDAAPRHQGAYLRAQAIWHSLDKTTIQSNLRPRIVGAEAKAYKAVSRRNLLIGGAATAAAAGIAAMILVPEMARKSLKTSTGEMRKVPLPDRTMASLNSASHLEFNMTPRLRRVVLVEGEALFEVAKNPDQPFVVEAGNVHVRAVGTAFSVRRRDGGADVMVTEGIVEAWAEGGTADRQKLIAGQETFISENAETITVSSAPQEVERKLAWRDGKVILNNQTLSEAVDEFNRYNAVQIVIADPALRQRRFVGQYRIDQPEDFADTVRSLLEVPVQIKTDSITLGASGSASGRTPNAGNKN